MRSFPVIILCFFLISSGVLWPEEKLASPSSPETLEPSEERKKSASKLPVECEFCKRKRQYWKFFPHKIEHLIEENNLARLEFLLLPVIIILYILTGFLIYKGKQNKKVRMAIQTIAFIVLGLIFIQCLCNVKEFTVGIRNLVEKKPALAFGACWMALFTTIFTVAVRKKFRKVYCYWICPLGFAQDLVGQIGLHRKCSQPVKLVILFIIGFGVIFAIAWNRPYQPIRDAGFLLAGAMVILAIFSLLYPKQKRLLGYFRYLALIFWIGINVKHKVSGPWCTIAVANIHYPVIVEFLCVLFTSLVIPRAWCKYTCPDGGFFELISRTKK